MASAAPAGGSQVAGARPASEHPDAVAVIDDTGREVVLPRPARRVVSLTPALTELAFAAGGGDRLVGVVDGSDYPPAARALPRVGDALGLSVEAILAARPDLVLAWVSGNDPRPVAALGRLGIPVFHSQIDTLEQIATTLERLGHLLNSPGAQAARDFRAGLERLGPARGEGGGDAGAADPVRVFYQVWDEPLMTVNGRHWISDLIGRCGGSNVFGSRPELVPRVGVEAVVAAAPEAIIGTRQGPPAGGHDPLQRWQRFPGIPAVASGFVFLVDGDAVSRTTPRTLEAGAAICRHLDRVRAAGGGPRRSGP